MLLEPDHWHFGYSQIVLDCRNGGSVLLCCHSTVDSCASAAIWTSLLRADGIAYTLIATPTIPSLLQAWKDHSPTAIVCLNIGATVNLQDYVSSTKVYVIDAARPIHLANAYHNNLVVFHTPDDTELPSDGDELSLESSDSESDGESESSSSSEEEFNNDEDEEEEAEFQFQDAADADENPQDDTSLPAELFMEEELVDDGAEADDEGDEEDEDLSKTNKAPVLADTTMDTTTVDSTPPLSARQRRQDRRQRIRAYYTANWTAVPASWVSYQLAHRHQHELVWWAAIGVTDAWMHHRLDRVGYTELALDLQTQVHQLFPNDVVQRAGQTMYAEDLSGDTNATSSTAISVYQPGSLLCETDFRLFLLRHSSLYQALTRSEYVSSQLGVVQKEDRLLEWLASKGIPLDQARQPFDFLHPNLKRRLPQLLSDDEFLSDLHFTSFLRVEGYGRLTSAADVVYATAALLDQDDWNVAYDALVHHGRQGLPLAKSIQQRMLDQAHWMVEGKNIVTLHHFRYAFLNTTSTNWNDNDERVDDAVLAKETKDEASVFARPLALTRLAHYLYALEPRWKEKPLILLAQDTQSYLVAGFDYGISNKWGQHLRMAAESLQANVQFDLPEGHLCRVPSTHVQKFMEQLHYLMDSM